MIPAFEVPSYRCFGWRTFNTHEPFCPAMWYALTRERAPAAFFLNSIDPPLPAPSRKGCVVMVKRLRRTTNEYPPPSREALLPYFPLLPALRLTFNRSKTYSPPPCPSAAPSISYARVFSIYVLIGWMADCFL